VHAHDAKETPKAEDTETIAEEHGDLAQPDAH
jgi:hypothetical protein